MNEEDYEWLGYNWRNLRIASRNFEPNEINSQKIKNLAFLKMIDEGFEFFPSLY